MTQLLSISPQQNQERNKIIYFLFLLMVLDAGGPSDSGLGAWSQLLLFVFDVELSVLQPQYCSVMKFYFTTRARTLPQPLARLDLQYEMQQRSAWPGALNLSPAEGSCESFTLSSPATRHHDQSGFLSKSLLLIITRFYYRYF